MFDKKHDTDDDVIYELPFMRQMGSNFVGKFFVGAAFAYSVLWMPFFLLKFLFAAVAIGTLGPLVKDIWGRQIKGLKLTRSYLDVTKGLGREHVRIYLDEIKRVELVEKQVNTKHRRYERRRYDEVSTVLVERSSDRAKDWHPDTKCIITTQTGLRLEIPYKYFNDGDFDDFLDIFQATHQMAIEGLPQPQKDEIDHKMRLHKRLEPKDEISILLDENDILLQQNKKYLRDEQVLKKELEDSLRDTYRTIYFVRDALEVSLMDREAVHIIYEYRNPDNTVSFVLQNDYKPNLGDDNIQTGRLLVEAASKNLSLVDTRIAYYAQIIHEHETIKFQLENKRKLKKLTTTLENLQTKNTNKSLDISVENLSADINSDLLNSLKELTERVHGLNDLEKAMMLNQHITLFREGKQQ
ncbi:MAG: hypothetical protein EAZ67_10745 [Cytophagales bacterium]|nr:MAG: hypothetical protein EAZ67_10745 [Cytophagales bacterium]